MDDLTLTVDDQFSMLQLYFDMYSLSPVIYGDNGTEKIPEQTIISRGFIRVKVTQSSKFIDYQVAYVKLRHEGTSTQNLYSAEIAYWHNGEITPILLSDGGRISLKVSKCTNDANIDI